MSIFNELKSSFEDAVDIKHKRKEASRATRYIVADVKAIRARLHVSQRSLPKP